jgi:uncharacterized protein (TIGR02118 family)
MIKVFALLTAEPGTRAAFQRHWREVHAPLVERMSALRRYSQSHCFDTGFDALEAAHYDGISEMWLDDLDTATSIVENPKPLHGALAGVPSFLTNDGVDFLVTRENVVIPGPELTQEASGVKLLVLVKRKPGMSVAEFQDHWRNTHAPLVLSTPHITRYVQCYVPPETYEQKVQPAFDGVAEAWFPDLASYSAGSESDSMKAQFDDVPKFIDTENITISFAHEHRVVWP